ncbi:alpha/beta fold hydrolase [Curtobacterium sp. RRHDQ10]|uniref:alpha/beta fold hydrolase n=1 Tax=Curtobacterium phyllosphaerae TaxID=3413379 RepID=UPI003BF106BE
MHVIMVPGMWLDASAWDDVVPIVRRAGHEVETMSLPGQESVDADRAGIGFDDWVQAVVDRVDAASRATSGAEGIALVGHSAAGTVVSVAADRRASRLAAVVYVDSAPFPEGDHVDDEFPVVDGEIPWPDRSGFGDAMLREMTDELWATMTARAIPVPGGIVEQSFRFTDPARHAIPTTILASEMASDEITAGIVSRAGWAAELVATEDLRIVGIPTGHWAMFTRPDELGARIVEAIAPRPARGA